MIELLLTLLAFVATAICVGLYWQVQKNEARVARQAAEVREQALVVGELADEISMASTYLYEAMDRFLGDVETQLQAARELTPVTSAPPGLRTSVEEKAVSAPEPTPIVAEEEPAWWELLEEDETPELTVAPESKPESTPAPYHPHFQALALAAEGKDLVEIARQTDLGVEELRLLLHFQDELSISG
jgi:hypothetical protein